MCFTMYLHVRSSHVCKYEVVMAKNLMCTRYVHAIIRLSHALENIVQCPISKSSIVKNEVALVYCIHAAS